MAGIIVVFPKIEDSKAIRNLLVHNGYDNAVSYTHLDVYKRQIQAKVK